MLQVLVLGFWALVVARLLLRLLLLLLLLLLQLLLLLLLLQVLLRELQRLPRLQLRLHHQLLLLLLGSGLLLNPFVHRSHSTMVKQAAAQHVRRRPAAAAAPPRRAAQGGLKQRPSASAQPRAAGANFAPLLSGQTQPGPLRGFCKACGPPKRPRDCHFGYCIKCFATRFPALHAQRLRLRKPSKRQTCLICTEAFAQTAKKFQRCCKKCYALRVCGGCQELNNDPAAPMCTQCNSRLATWCARCTDDAQRASGLCLTCAGLASAATQAPCAYCHEHDAQDIPRLATCSEQDCTGVVLCCTPCRESMHAGHLRCLACWRSKGQLCIACGKTPARRARHFGHKCWACTSDERVPASRTLAQRVLRPEAMDFLAKQQEKQTFDGTEPALQLLVLPKVDSTPLPKYEAQPRYLSPAHCRICLADCTAGPCVTSPDEDATAPGTDGDLLSSGDPPGAAAYSANDAATVAAHPEACENPVLLKARTPQ